MSELLNENPELVEEKAESAAPAEEAAAQPAQEEAPAEKSFDEMSFSEALEASLQSMNTDQKVKGTVVGMSPSEIQVDIGRKHAGYIPLDEFSADPTVNPLEAVKVGDVLDLIIMKTNDAEGTVMLSKKRFDAIKAWDDVVKASEDESILEGVITDVIKGGVLASTNGVRVFTPASLATASRGEPLDGLLHQHVQFRIIEVNKPRRRAVGSIRAVLKEARKAAEDAFWAQAEVGQVYTGTVRTIVSYGAFVDIGVHQDIRPRFPGTASSTPRRLFRWAIRSRFISKRWIRRNARFRSAIRKWRTTPGRSCAVIIRLAARLRRRLSE